VAFQAGRFLNAFSVGDLAIADVFMKNDNSEEAASEKVRLCAAQLTQSLFRHVVAIFRRNDNGKPESMGTGLLVSSCADTFVVSAGHVFNELMSGRNLFFYAGPQLIHQLAGSFWVSNPPTAGDKKAGRYDIDIGVIRLLRTAPPPNSIVDKEPLPLAALIGNALPRHSKQYLVTGFPGSKTKLNPVHRIVDSKPYANLCVSPPQPMYEKIGCSSQTHLLMPFVRKHVLGPGSKRHTFPNPEGMSGSPVWLLYDDVGPNDPVQTPVVGILIEYHRSRHLLLATDISHAIKMINDNSQCPRCD